MNILNTTNPMGTEHLKMVKTITLYFLSHTKKDDANKVLKKKMFRSTRRVEWERTRTNAE